MLKRTAFLGTKAMGTLVKFPGRQRKEADAKNRNLSTCIFGRSFILFTTTSRSEKLVTLHWLQNAKQRFRMKCSRFKATLMKNAHEVILSVCFK